jgi:predicted secreted protein
VGSNADPNIVSTERERGAKQIGAALGETFPIHLWEDRTRGELWVPTFDQTKLAPVSDEFLRTASNNAVDAGQRTFEFRALAPGTHRVVFEKRMGWKFTAEDRRVFLVVVTEGAGVQENNA